MARLLAAILLMIVGGFAGTFFISHEFEAQEERLRDTNTAIRSERDRYRVLRAEWASLNDPARIEATLRAAQALAPNLILAPTTGQQVLTDLGLIPERMQPGTPMPGMPFPMARPFGRRPAPGPSPSHDGLPEGGLMLVSAEGVDS
jgi:hypothetical protein